MVHKLEAKMARPFWQHVPDICLAFRRLQQVCNYKTDRKPGSRAVCASVAAALAMHSFRGKLQRGVPQLTDIRNMSLFVGLRNSIPRRSLSELTQHHQATSQSAPCFVGVLLKITPATITRHDDLAPDRQKSKRTFGYMHPHTIPCVLNRSSMATSLINWSSDLISCKNADSDRVTSGILVNPCSVSQQASVVS